jgi:hypothetical protein
MRKLTYITRLAFCAAGLFLFTAMAPAGEKKLMHCFAFTAVEGATPADWKAFYDATDQLPKKIPVISHVWYGKLRRPLTVDGNARQYGVCMEMANEGALKTYTDHPFHKQWVDVYSKVRVEGTTTFDILGQ